MLEETKLEIQHLGELYSKGHQSDPHSFDLGKLSHSGRHIHDVTEE